MAKRLCSNSNKNIILKRIAWGSRVFLILLWLSRDSSGFLRLQDRSETNRVPVAWEQGCMDFC